MNGQTSAISPQGAHLRADVCDLSKVLMNGQTTVLSRVLMIPHHFLI